MRLVGLGPGARDAQRPESSLLDAGGLSPGQLFWRGFRRDRMALSALVFIAVVVLLALAAPLVTSLVGVPGPDVQDSRAVDSFGTPSGPDAVHPLGVDPLGRDVLSRILYGARVSLVVAAVATALSMTIGVVVGMVAGFFGGWIDMLLSRLIDLLLAFPILLLCLGLAASCSLGEGCLGGAIRPGVGTVILVIAVVSWTHVARIIRGQVLVLREQAFIEAARSLGTSNRRILRSEILPNLTAPIVVYGALFIPQVMLIEAALSFLGVGVPPPTPSWGAMIADAASIFDSAWWYMTFPGAALLLTVLAFNLVGDGMQAALDPHASRHPAVRRRSLPDVRARSRRES